MRIFKRWFFFLLPFCFFLACNPFQEMKEGKEAAEKANKEAKIVLGNAKEYSEKAEAAAQRAEKAAAISEEFSKKAEAAGQKAVSSFEKHLKK